MDAPDKNAQHDQPINYTSIKAIRHLLNALDALQQLETATDAACVIAHLISDGIRVEVARLWGNGDE